MENIGKVWFEEKGRERGGEEDYFSRCEDGNVQTLAGKMKVMNWDKRDVTKIKK